MVIAQSEENLIELRLRQHFRSDFEPIAAFQEVHNEFTWKGLLGLVFASSDE